MEATKSFDSTDSYVIVHALMLVVYLFASPTSSRCEDPMSQFVSTE